MDILNKVIKKKKKAFRNIQEKPKAAEMLSCVENYPLILICFTSFLHIYYILPLSTSCQSFGNISITSNKSPPKKWW